MGTKTQHWRSELVDPMVDLHIHFSLQEFLPILLAPAWLRDVVPPPNWAVPSTQNGLTILGAEPQPWGLKLVDLQLHFSPQEFPPIQLSLGWLKDVVLPPNQAVPSTQDEPLKTGKGNPTLGIETQHWGLKTADPMVEPQLHFNS